MSEKTPMYGNKANNNSLMQEKCVTMSLNKIIYDWNMDENAVWSYFLENEDMFTRNQFTYLRKDNCCYDILLTLEGFLMMAIMLDMTGDVNDNVEVFEYAQKNFVF